MDFGLSSGVFFTFFIDLFTLQTAGLIGFGLFYKFLAIPFRSHPTKPPQTEIQLSIIE
jgi:hypothetical protein